MAEQPNPLDVFGSGADGVDVHLPTTGQAQDNSISTENLPVAPVATVLRKQNVACDACRAKKIRCQRTSTAEKCAQCTAKDVDCTSHYIEQLQTKTKKARRKTGDGVDGSRKRQRGDGEAVFDDPVALLQEVSMATLQSSLGDGSNGETSRAGRDRMSLGRNPLQKTGSERKDDLLQYLFSPSPVAHYDWGYTDFADMEQCLAGASDLWEEDGGRVWVEEPTQAHLNLGEQEMKELADDLLETYFSIAHPRWPAFDPGHLKARFQSPDTHPDGPAEQPLIALCIAFGARFSDHPVIEADRNELAQRDDAQFGPGMRPPRSRLVQLLIIRCREVVEVHKCHRVRKLLNALILVNLESLLAQVPTLGSKYIPYHYQAAVKHVIILGYNNPDNLLAIKDEKERAQAVNAWWMICLVDGFRSVFHRLPSSLNEINYTAPDIPDGVLDKPPGIFGDQADQAVVSQPRLDALKTYISQVWFSAASTSSALCRDLSRGLWNAKAMQEGIRISSLRGFVSAMTDWKDKYLAILGVPEKVPESWGFFNAITATGTDTYLHTLWLVIERAIKDFGIYELKQKAHGSDVKIDEDYEEVRKRIKDEAEHAALRITGLISVLKANSYLRLDPLILYHPICEAGWYLSAQGRPEAQSCVDGLKQYALAYPCFWDTALDMERTLALTLSALAGSGAQRQSLFESNDIGSGELGEQLAVPAQGVRTPIGVSTLPGSIPRELSQDAGAILSGFLQQR